MKRENGRKSEAGSPQVIEVSVLSSLLASLVPQIVAATISELKKQQIAPAPSPVPVDRLPVMACEIKIYKTAKELGDAIGVSRYIISAMRKASRMPGDSPLPNYCTAEEAQNWLSKHPNFSARRVFKDAAESPHAPSKQPHWRRRRSVYQSTAGGAA